MAAGQGCIHEPPEAVLSKPSGAGAGGVRRAEEDVDDGGRLPQAVGTSLGQRQLNWTGTKAPGWLPS